MHGYSGINFRSIGEAVPSKANLGVAVARRYWQGTDILLDALRDADPSRSLRLYTSIFRASGA
ncbi:TetR/AcrR family transcriptional regulator [Pseudomonas syringae]|uniref:TetR/AcrR family transcriptional regulator n=1 Tax=Pseudomonas syringae TaxID=317 RepID=UPI00359C8F69